MALALALGRRGLGRTWPNPAVGAVIVRDDGAGPVIVGRGWTQPGGRPACRDRGAAARRRGRARRHPLCDARALLASRQDAALRRRHRGGRHRARRLGAWSIPIRRWRAPAIGGWRSRGSRSRSVSARTRRSGRMPATSAACAMAARTSSLKLAVSADGKAGLAGRRPAAITGEAARARVPSHARDQRRGAHRHRHSARRRSAADLPAARHGGALAGARRARQRIAACRSQAGSLATARETPLWVVGGGGGAAGTRAGAARTRAPRCCGSPAVSRPTRSAGGAAASWPSAASPG